MQQPHQDLRAVPVITVVPACRDEFYGVGLQKLFAQDLIAFGRDRNRLDKDVDFIYCMNSSKTHDTASLEP